ncbi:ATP-binding cassette domain-containing protein [uncultured Oscillibacter sp.]|uniref:ATP-binding cassette domain-containing protein n=1 Tax=uncultured Oscillibacter sp. TaxID=876091 RepID=UPI002625D174|nr:ATP-binding cassette domain-containing protein [uncultured Oscillibacter sp.]
MLLEMRDIVKVYGNVTANNHVNLSLNQGEILAVVGENGAGKSTIMKILYGMEKATSGEVFLNGEPVHFRSPADAIAKGIGMVQQHFMLFQSMTVTENIVYRNERRKGIFYDREANNNVVRELAKTYGLQVDPGAVISDLPVGTQQRVEILKILYQNANIIIFDEPSAVLTPLEVDELLKTMRHLADMGKSLIIITHKLREVMEIADRVVVMRAGEVVGETLKSETSIEQLSFIVLTGLFTACKCSTAWS